MRLRATGVIPIAFVVWSCAPRPHERPPMFAATARDSSVALAVRGSRSRPSFASLVRAGDPEGAVSFAVAAPRSTPTAHWENLALARLWELRLREQGFRPTVTADSVGLRITQGTTDASMSRQFVRALGEIASRATTALEARSVVAALERESLPRISPAYAPLAACAGEAGIVSTQVLLPIFDRSAIEGLRADALRDGAVAIGAVGPTEITEAASAELESAPHWPLSERPRPVRPWQAAHSVAVSASPSGGADLDIAWPISDPVRATELAAVQRRARSPMRSRLELSNTGFHLAAAQARVLPEGACLRLHFRGDGRSRERLPRAAAEAFLVADELVRATPQELGSTDGVARSIAAVPSAGRAAELAAWWSVARAGDSDFPSKPSSLLSLPPERGDDERTFHELEREYAAAVAYETRATASAVKRASTSSVRATIEPGQGESWLLVANECAIAEESLWNAGTSALGAWTASAIELDGGVVVEPWVRPDGVGLLVHGGREDGETGQRLGRRLAAALGAAITSVPFSPERVADSRAALLPVLSEPALQRVDAFLETFSRGTSMTMQPHGTLSRLFSATGADVEHRWRSLVRTGLRAAMLASVDELEPTSAMRELRSWLPNSDHGGCSVTMKDDAAGGSHRISTRLAEAFGLLYVRGSVKDWPVIGALALELDAMLAARLRPNAKDGRLRGSVRWVGGRRAPAILVEYVGTTGEVEHAVDATRDRLSIFGESGAGSVNAASAAKRWQRERSARAGSPRGRVESLWLGKEAPVPQPEEIARWATANLIADRFQVLVGTPSSP